MPHEFVARQLKQVRVFGLFRAVPALKRVAVVHVLGHLLVVVGVDQLVVHQHVLPPGFVLQFLHLFDEFLVGRQERQGCLPLPGHQGFTDKNLPRGVWVHTPVVHAPAAVHQEAVQRGTLQRHHFPSFFLPMRVQQLLFEQMATHRLQPQGLDMGNTTAKQARGFHQFAGHNPAARLFAQVRAGVGKKLDGPRAQVFAGIAFGFNLAANIAQKPGQHGLVQVFVTGGFAVERPFVFGNHRHQLLVDVAPLAQAARVDKTGPQLLFFLAVGAA